MPLPVAVFAYKRPDHTFSTLEALARNPLARQTHLSIFSDGPKDSSDAAAVSDVRRVAHSTSGFASVQVIERPVNMGLANSIIAGVTALFDRHDTVIVLEDDLVTSPNFLTYMNTALEHYRDDPRVFSITGYVFPPEYIRVPADYPYDTFAGYRCASWSWGTWKNRWRRIRWDMDYFESFTKDRTAQEEFNRGGQDMSALLKLQYENKIDSWAIRFCYAHHVHNMRCIYPIKSLVRNIGLDSSGTHSKKDARFFHDSLDASWVPQSFCPTESEDFRIARNFRAIFDPVRTHIALRIARYIARLIHRTG